MLNLILYHLAIAALIFGIFFWVVHLNSKKKNYQKIYLIFIFSGLFFSSLYYITK